jgi:hypothetical protein
VFENGIYVFVLLLDLRVLIDGGVGGTCAPKRHHPTSQTPLVTGEHKDLGYVILDTELLFVLD